MSHYFTFVKKEVLEGLRTSRMLVMLLVFLGFGILSPLTAKLTPNLLELLVPEGLSFNLPEPGALDSWAQFFKNTSQMGLIVTIVVFSGIMANELSRGTMINMLTKGLSRNAVVLAKYTYMVLLWSLSLAFCALVTQAYTVFLWPSDNVASLFFSIACLCLFGAFLLAVLLFAACCFDGVPACLLTSGSVVVVMLVANIFPNVEKYNPLSLASLNVELLMGVVKAADLYWSIGITAVLTVMLVVASVLVFRKKQL
ncbi:MAG: ABC transporter permease [Coriobacteriia bacterium]|nr:ABC transporter permease [Coriobacteriia bacterium]